MTGTTLHVLLLLLGTGFVNCLSLSLSPPMTVTVSVTRKLFLSSDCVCHNNNANRLICKSAVEDDLSLESSSLPSRTGLTSSLRCALRGMTGFSLTATRAACRAATGISISTLLAKALSIFPLILRFFIQPLLIFYYTPFVLLRAVLGPSKEFKSEQRAAHEVLVEGWKSAVQAAEKANEGGYWPVHVDEKGSLKFVSPPNPDNIFNAEIELNKAIVKSVEAANRS